MTRPQQTPVVFAAVIDLDCDIQPLCYRLQMFKNLATRQYLQRLYLTNNWCSKVLRDLSELLIVYYIYNVVTRMV